jgi:putative ABC transport system ATP-binding protein
MSEHIVSTEELSRYYELGGMTIKALDAVTLEIRRGDYVSIVGPSGSGKTTLFNLIGGLDRPTKGNVFIDEVELSKLDAYELAWLRCHKVGYIFQTFNLLSTLTALDNVSLPMIFAGVRRNERFKRATNLLDLVGLGDRLHHRPGELSAGQQQRVAIARALANNPTLILADEPTGNLDSQTGSEVIHILRQLNQDAGVTIIAATHDLKIIDVSDSIFWLRDGTVDHLEDRKTTIQQPE